jgi:hypothetical protein
VQDENFFKYYFIERFWKMQKCKTKILNLAGMDEWMDGWNFFWLSPISCLYFNFKIHQYTGVAQYHGHYYEDARSTLYNGSVLNQCLMHILDWTVFKLGTIRLFSVTDTPLYHRPTLPKFEGLNLDFFIAHSNEKVTI